MLCAKMTFCSEDGKAPEMLKIEIVHLLGSMNRLSNFNCNLSIRFLDLLCTSENLGLMVAL